MANGISMDVLSKLDAIFTLDDNKEEKVFSFTLTDFGNSLVKHCGASRLTTGLGCVSDLLHQ